MGKESPTWWIAYYVNGEKIRESSGTANRTEAVKLLNQRLAESGRNVSRRDLARVGFEQLADLLVADYKKNERRSPARLERLRAAFGQRHVAEIGEAEIDRYAADRLEAGAAAGTINRELAALRRMFRLGLRARLVERVPVFTMLAENNVRKGFMEEAEFSDGAVAPAGASPRDG